MAKSTDDFTNFLPTRRPVRERTAAPSAQLSPEQVGQTLNVEAARVPALVAATRRQLHAAYATAHLPNKKLALTDRQVTDPSGVGVSTIVTTGPEDLTGIELDCVLNAYGSAADRATYSGTSMPAERVPQLTAQRWRVQVGAPDLGTPGQGIG